MIIKNSSIHGAGAFAERDYAPDEVVAEYVGERIDKRESEARCEAGNTFIFTLDDEVDIDGDVDWNPAKFINHSCEPNCVAEIDNGRVWIKARRAIRKGEELSFNYGYDLANYEEYPCRCGTRACRGFMVAEEFFDKIARK